MFQVTRIYSDSNGDSHFEVIEVPLKEAGSVGKLSETLPANGVVCFGRISNHNKAV